MLRANNQQRLPVSVGSAVHIAKARAVTFKTTLYKAQKRASLKVAASGLKGITTPIKKAPAKTGWGGEVVYIIPLLYLNFSRN